MDNFSPLAISPETLEEIEREEKYEKQFRKQLFLHFDYSASLPLYQYLRLHKELWNDPAAFFLYERFHQKVLMRGLSLLDWDDSPLPEKTKMIDDYHDMEINYHKDEIEQYGRCIAWLLTLMNDYCNHKTHE